MVVEAAAVDQAVEVHQEVEVEVAEEAVVWHFLLHWSSLHEN